MSLAGETQRKSGRATGSWRIVLPGHLTSEILGRQFFTRGRSNELGPFHPHAGFEDFVRQKLTELLATIERKGGGWAFVSCEGGERGSQLRREKFSV